MTKRQIRLHQYLIRTGEFENKQEIVEILKYKNIKLIASRKNKYIILNKPSGYLSSRLTREDIKLNKKTLFSLLEEDLTLFCIRRLDENTEGLIIVTNDGKLSHKIANPQFKVKKTYLVELTKELDSKSKKILETGIDVNKQLLKPLEVNVRSNNKSILIILNEGKKREIRLMFENINYEIKKLTRIKIGKLDLSKLNIGLGKTLNVTKEFILENLDLPDIK